MSHIHHGANHRPVGFAGGQLASKGTVDLDQIHRQRTYELERTGATAEVAEAEPAAELFHLDNEVRHRLNVVDRGGFSQLEPEPLNRRILLTQLLVYELQQRLIVH